MPFYFPDTPDLPLPPGHRFPASKYRLLREMAQRTGIFQRVGLAPSPAASLNELSRAHDAGYIHKIMTDTLPAQAMRRIGVPWSETLVQRTLATVGGSLAAARDARQYRISGQLAGGTHHAHRNFGSGFCVFNDLAVTALTLLAEGEAKRITILDCDVHQGDGTAAILAQVPEVQTISIHGAKNFPFRKAASDLDIPLSNGTGDKDYLIALDSALEALDAFKPDLLLYLSGADALSVDRLGRLSLTQTGLAVRDETVFRFAHERGLPVSIAIGGGYAEPVSITVDAYMQTFRSAARIYGF